MQNEKTKKKCPGSSCTQKPNAKMYAAECSCLCFFFPPVLHCWRPLLMMMILCRVLSTRRQHPVLILVLHLILVLVLVLVLVS